VPTKDEWSTLVEYLGGATVAGAKMKSPNLWIRGSAGTDNSSGFTALPSAYCTNIYYQLGFVHVVWSNTVYDTNSAWSVQLEANVSSVAFYHDSKKYGFSIRCVKD